MTDEKTIKDEKESAGSCRPAMTGYLEVWLFDVNRREYRRDQKGRSYGGPIWIKHWVKTEIVSETTKSWVTSCGKKISKKGGRGIAFSWEYIDQIAFIEDNKIQLCDLVRQIDDYEIFMKIAELARLGR